MWNPFARKYFKVSWFGEMGCGYPTDESFYCYAYNKRDAHRQFLTFIEPDIRRQYTCEERLRSFKETEPEIIEVTDKPQSEDNVNNWLIVVLIIIGFIAFICMFHHTRY